MLWLIILIVIIGVVLAYAPGLPAPVRTLLVVVMIILAVVAIIVALQMVGLLPPVSWWDAPARVR